MWVNNHDCPCSYHPYLFFNQDTISITFVGFSVNQQGDLLDPVRKETIERASMNIQLHAGLKQNQVNLSENYQLWDKQTMIEKIGMVMGLESVKDPDPSYVLIVDNVIKMLAIQMRFRYKNVMALSHPNSMQPLVTFPLTGATSQWWSWEKLAVERPVSSDTCVTY